MKPSLEKVRVRTLFVSDFHLGTRGCQADLLLDFLRRYDAETIYLVGDIIDGWRLKSGWYWPQTHSEIVHTLLAKMRDGTRLYYIPGNHDEFLRDFISIQFGDITILDKTVHVTADGRRLLVIHGDQFDVVIRHVPWLALLGDQAYRSALWANRTFNVARRRLGFTYWSLSSWAKLRVKNAVSFIGRFEECLADEARRHRADGVVCGHIHHAVIRRIGEIEYLNTGDWVESCTAIVEQDDGELQLVRWAEQVVALPRPVVVAEGAMPG